MRVLIVEDEPDILSALVRILRDEGYAVDSARDGLEALEKSKDWDYDAILLDIMMPELDGFGVLERLRLRGSKTPVLILTARGATTDRIQGLDLGADDYLIKPFDMNELLARMRALIRRAAGNATSEMEIGDVIVNFAARTVTIHGEIVSLTAREQVLVEYLAQHRGRWMTRSQLYEHLFDENADQSSNLLDVHVSNVRKKLGNDFIITRRGIGYSIAK
ncbi:MAG: response regulator transcription factor [Verrucomicrobiales bacterium]